MGKGSLLTLFFLFCSFLTLQAEEAPIAIKATVDKKEVAQDEYFNYRIVISSSASIVNPKIKLPHLEKDFVILSSSRSQNIAISGGKTRIQIVLDYFLNPKKEGEVTIGTAEVSYRGKNYTSESITIKAGPAKNPAPKIPQEEEPQESATQEKITL